MLVSGVIQSHSCGEVWYVSKWCHPVSFLWRGLGCEFTVVCMIFFFLLMINMLIVFNVVQYIIILIFHAYLMK
jgi:hypothetical protein